MIKLRFLKINIIIQLEFSCKYRTTMYWQQLVHYIHLCIYKVLCFTEAYRYPNKSVELFCKEF